VDVDGHFYSVPHPLVHEVVDVRLTTSTVEIFHRGVRVASHALSRVKNEATTINAHRPKAHQRHLEWTPSRLIDWAAQTGPRLAALVAQVLESKRHPEQGFRSCLGIRRLAEKYGAERAEPAAERALAGHIYTLSGFQSILEHGLDRVPLQAPPEPPPLPDHPNIRGPQYYESAEGDSASC